MDNITKDAVLALNKEIADLKTRMDNLEIAMDAKSTVSQLNSVAADLREDDRVVANLLTKLEEKLRLVVLPEETQYYMTQEGMNQITKNVQENQSLLIELHKLRRSVLEIITKFNLANNI